MTRYVITHQPTGEELLTCWAPTVEVAAQRQARRYHRGATAHRLTGREGGSGVFAVYRYDRKLAASNQIGSEFHVREATQAEQAEEREVEP